jgi:membrane protease YdiL (CAAX protease family)
MLESIIIVGAGIYVSLLIFAPYSNHYFRMKRLAFVSGLVIAILIPLALADDIKWTLSPAAIPAAIGVAHLSVFVALSSATYSFSRGWRHLKQCYPNLSWEHLSVFKLIVILLAAIYEEMIWRQFFMTMLGHTSMANILVTLLFCACHISAQKKIRFPRMLDLGFFSLLIGICFQITKSFAFVALVHWIRNSLVFLIRYRLDPEYRQSVHVVQKELLLRFPVFSRISAMIRK